MKAILIEIEGGLVTKVATLENAPRGGVVIVDHDNLDCASDEALDDTFDNHYEPDGEIEDYETYKASIIKTYEEEYNQFKD